MHEEMQKCLQNLAEKATKEPSCRLLRPRQEDNIKNDVKK